MCCCLDSFPQLIVESTWLLPSSLSLPLSLHLHLSCLPVSDWDDCIRRDHVGNDECDDGHYYCNPFLDIFLSLSPYNIMIPFFKESLFWCKHVWFCLTVAVSLICKRRIAFVVIDVVGFFCLSLISACRGFFFSRYASTEEWMTDTRKKGRERSWSLITVEGESVLWCSLFFRGRKAPLLESNANRQADDQIEKWSRRWSSSSSHEKKDLSICLISCCCNYLKNTREREKEQFKGTGFKVNDHQVSSSELRKEERMIIKDPLLSHSLRELEKEKQKKKKGEINDCSPSDVLHHYFVDWTPFPPPYKGGWGSSSHSQSGRE